MNAKEFSEKMKHHKITLKKVRGHALHQVCCDNLHNSYHENRRAGKAHIIGAGFFKDLKKGLHTAVKVGKSVAPLVGLVTGQPEMASTAHTYLSAADQAMGGRINFSDIKKGLKTAVKIGKVVVPMGAMLTGNPMLAAAASTGLSAADQALGGNMSGGGYGRQMSGGSNLSGAGNMSGGRQMSGAGKMMKGSPEAKAHMARLRAMRKK